MVSRFTKGKYKTKMYMVCLKMAANSLSAPAAAVVMKTLNKANSKSN